MPFLGSRKCPTEAHEEVGDKLKIGEVKSRVKRKRQKAGRLVTSCFPSHAALSDLCSLAHEFTCVWNALLLISGQMDPSLQGPVRVPCETLPTLNSQGSDCVSLGK